ncbi:MAG: aminotransferase class V-fold PLP-dependent enzyme [Microbacteriaceae bacterium]
MLALKDYLGDFREEPGYLDFAGFGPLSSKANEESLLYSELLTHGRYGSLDHLKGNETRLKTALSQSLGFSAEQFVFQRSVENAYFQVFFGLGTGLLIAASESPGAVYAAVRAQQAMGQLVAIWMASDYGRITPSSVREQLTSGTGAVFVSQVDHRTGHVVDLEGIREVIGDRLLILDVTQGLGAVSSPYQLADVVVGSGSTWLRAGFGTAFLALSERAVERLRPVLSGNSAAQPVEHFDQIGAPESGAAAFQISSPDPIAQARLAAVLERMNAIGQSKISAALQQGVDTLVDIVHAHKLTLLSPVQSVERSGIVTFAAEAGRELGMIAALHNHGITATQQQQSIRMSVHISSTNETFDMVRHALSEA